MKLYNFKSFYNRHLGNVLIGVLLFYFINSFLIKIFRFFYFENLIIPIFGLLKGAIVFTYLSILIVNFKRKKNILNYLGLLFVIFLAGNIKWDLDIKSFLNSYNSFRLSNLFCFIKYLYPFVFIGVFSLVKNKEEIISRYFSIVEKVLIVNAVCVFFGFLFSIDFLQSYIHTSRFGYSGLLEAGFFEYSLIIVISRRVFLNKTDLIFMLLSLVSLFIGTKAMILFFIVLLFYYLYEKRHLKLLMCYSGFLFFVLFFFKTIVDFFIKLFPFWNSVLNKYGYIGLLSSTRNWNVQNSLEYIRINGTLKNLFVGGLDFSKSGVEMDFVDLFLFFGVIGFVLYLLLLCKLINKSYHLIPLLVAFFVGDFLLGTIIVCTYFLWISESDKEKNNFLYRI